MNIGRALMVAVVGMALVLASKAMAEEVLYHVHFTALTPRLRDLVTKEFPKDPDLKVYLDKADIDFPHQDCRDPLTKISGAIVPLTPKGDLGAVIMIEGCGWGGTAGFPLHIFLKRNGKWKQVGATMTSVGTFDVLQTTDHGFYRLDLGPERDCPDEGKLDTDGIMIWKGKEYDRLHPCLDDPIGGTLDRAQDIPYTPSQE